MQRHERAEVRARATGIEDRLHPKCHLHIHAYNRPLHGERANFFPKLDVPRVNVLSVHRSQVSIFSLPFLLCVYLQ